MQTADEMLSQISTLKTEIRRLKASIAYEKKRQKELAKAFQLLAGNIYGH